MYKLVISDDEGKNTVVPLVRDEITIGRKEGNTIRLTERNISRRHARLVKANGRFVIEDLHSYNGVRINGQRIGGETPLQAGDQIQIGDYQLALQLDGVETTATVPEQLSPMVADADTAMIAAPGPPARLVMITPPAPGAEFALTSDRCRIGRAEDLDIWVNHRSISREHAEIQKVADGGLRLIDLGSANGVRVNGKDVQNALLHGGDVVELGQVRFRFVAAGEHYAFDADRTVQVDAVTFDRPPTSSKLPIIAAVVIIGLAIVVAGGIALMGMGGDDTGGEIDARPLELPAPAETSAATFEQALAACEAAMQQLDLATAIAQADVALRERPGDRAAEACRQRATSLEPDARYFAEGARKLAAGDYEAAYFDFENLAGDSPFRSRPQVEQAVQGYANAQITAAQVILGSSPAEALRIAEFVLNMQGITLEQQTLARAIKREAQSSGAGSQVAQAGNRGRPVRTPPRSPRAPAPTRDRTERPAPAPERGGDDGGGSAGANLEEQARACTMSGDNGCVIRLLEGRARTQSQLAMLIEAYRARGQTQQSLRHMRTFVSRFPSTPRGRQYQQILARHGGN